MGVGLYASLEDYSSEILAQNVANPITHHPFRVNLKRSDAASLYFVPDTSTVGLRVHVRAHSSPCFSSWTWKRIKSYCKTTTLFSFHVSMTSPHQSVSEMLIYSCSLRASRQLLVWFHIECRCSLTGSGSSVCNRTKARRKSILKNFHVILQETTAVDIQSFPLYKCVYIRESNLKVCVCVCCEDVCNVRDSVHGMTEAGGCS